MDTVIMKTAKPLEGYWITNDAIYEVDNNHSKWCFDNTDLLPDGIDINTSEDPPRDLIGSGWVKISYYSNSVGIDILDNNTLNMLDDKIEEALKMFNTADHVEVIISFVNPCEVLYLKYEDIALSGLLKAIREYRRGNV